MAAPRGLKALLLKTSPGKLVRARAYTCYRATTPSGKPRGAKLRGVAKRLSELVFSRGELPVQSRAAGASRGGAFRGQDGGLRRGKAVDAQVSRLCKASAAARSKAKMLRLTRIVFHAMAHHKLEPVDAQRVVLDERRRLGTAVDVCCYDAKRKALVLVELKTGFAGDRALPVRDSFGRVLGMQAPLAKADDCALHRHLSQLAATHALFLRETGTLQALKRKGIHKVEGALLYVTDHASELHRLCPWWQKRGARLLDRLGRG